MEASTLIGVAAVVAGVLLVFSALPITHRLVRMIPQWTLTRGDIERVGSTTFATVLLGCFVATAGLVLLIEDLLWD
jgi:hypothetical protein